MRFPRFLICAGVATLTVSASAANAAIDLSTLHQNGLATATANDLSLTKGTARGAGSAFLTTAISSSSNFSGSFDISLIDTGSIGAATDPDGNPVLDGNGNPAGYGLQADGVTFLIQNSVAGTSALGGGGGGIGADGIDNSVGLGFQSWDNNHATVFAGTDTCDIHNDGNIFSSTYCGSGALENFGLGTNPANHIHVVFDYTNGVLGFSAFNSDTGQNIFQSRALDISALGPSVYLGFTGGTGLAYADQDISNFELNVAGVPEPATWAMMLTGFGGLGAMLRRRRRSALAPS